MKLGLQLGVLKTLVLHAQFVLLVVLQLTISSSSSRRSLKNLKSHQPAKLRSSSEGTPRRGAASSVIGRVHTCPVEMREKLAIPEAEWPRAIEELCNLNHIEEAAVLSTCNRIEIYVVALSQHRGVKEVTEWMSKGVSAISFASRGSCIGTSGADGMVCELDPITGNLLRKFKASTKAVTTICVSSAS